jgi:putative ABC transport system permease protein
MREAWAETPGVTAAVPLGISTVRASGPGRTAAVTAFGVPIGSDLAPDALVPAAVVLTEEAAQQLEAEAGDQVELGGTSFTVAAVSADASYSHTPVVWTTIEDWQPFGHGAHNDGVRATVLSITTTTGVNLAAADAEHGTQTVATRDARTAIGSFQAENGSLQLMRGFLFVISALVIGAFFTVWTIQRSADIAVLKALGAATGYLLRDALGQALLVLLAGTAIGTGLAVGLGALVEGSIPFVLDVATVVVPAAVTIALGAVGAALSVRRITSVDPLTALGNAR